MMFWRKEDSRIPTMLGTFEARANTTAKGQYNLPFISIYDKSPLTTFIPECSPRSREFVGTPRRILYKFKHNSVFYYFFYELLYRGVLNMLYSNLY